MESGVRRIYNKCLLALTRGRGSIYWGGTDPQLAAALPAGRVLAAG